MSGGDWTGADSGIRLLVLIAVLGLYFLPALAAFLRGHRRFWIILGLNILAAPAQTLLAYWLLPPLPADARPAAILAVWLLEVFGPAWLALMAWALRPVPDPDPRLKAAQGTKAFDLFAALPLIVWFGNSAMQLRPLLADDLGQMTAGEADLFTWLQFFSLGFSALFNLVVVCVLVARDKPVLRTRGWLPCLCAVAGTFLGVAILRLPPADLGLGLQAVVFVLIGGGSLASLLIAARLGKAFSVLPEARRLVTGGPYAWARHPLYAAEIVTIAGTAIQYQQPWAGVLGAAVVALQVTRSVYEEAVLARAFPEYADYRKRVKRFGVI